MKEKKLIDSKVKKTKAAKPNKSQAAKPNKGGRPSAYSEKIAKEICDAIADTEKGLAKLCKDNPHWPARSTIMRWLDERKKFQDQYARAKELQAELLAEQIIEIADFKAMDSTVNNNGDKVADNEYIQRSKLRVESRKWLVTKLLPKKYGDRVVQQHEGGDKPVEIKEVSDAKSKLFDKLTQIVAASSNSGSDSAAE